MDGACRGLFQESFDLGEGHLDGVEVGTVGRQEQDAGACGLDGFSDGDGLVGRQVVEDDDVAWERQANWRKVAGESPVGRRSNQPLPPRVMGRHSRGCRLSVDRGAYGRGRLSYEKPEIQDAEAFQDAEGNIASTVMVRGKRTLRSRRTQPHVRTLSRRDLGGLHAIPLS